jgi:sugar phosphate isomerase/epimerase
MKMRLSCFGTIKHLKDIDKAGYDCAELQIQEIMSLDDAAYRTALELIRHLDVSCEVFDNPIPLDWRISDKDFDLDNCLGFLEKGAERTSAMGARYYNFGNGFSRSLPDHGDIQAARDKNAAFLRMLCDVTAKYNITVLLEPLARRVSNTFLSLPEAVEFTRSFGRLNLKTFIDYRWYLASGRPLDDIVGYADQIMHVHLDNPDSEFPVRHFPAIDDGHDYSTFLGILKALCYKGIISIEANTCTDFGTAINKSMELFNSMNIFAYRS